MINSIKYYYNLNVDDIEQINDDYYFDNYVLRLYYRELDIQLYNYLIENNYYVHQIVYNRDNEYVTIINNKPYILLKMIKNDVINISKLDNYNILFNNKKNLNWDSLWTIKVDNLEKNIDNVKDIKIKKASNYYIGMTENAITLYRKLKLNNNYNLCHLRFNGNDLFYDPLNIIVDYKIRDYAEYLKKEFYINNKYYYDVIDRIITNNNYNDTMLFFIRMLYPTIFFDAYDNYIKNNLIDYTFYNKINDYEKYLKYIYKKIKRKYSVISIDWLK